MKQFITLPRELYKDFPEYSAPLDMEQENLLDPKKSPVFKHAKIQYFLAYKDGKPCGRIAAIIDSIAQKKDGKHRGTFGAFASVVEQDVVSALLKAAETWLAKHKITEIHGPTTLTPNGESGLLTDGFTSEAMIAMPWNPPGLEELLGKCGYTRTKRLFSYKLELTDEAEKKFNLSSSLEIGEGRLKNLEIQSLSKRNIAHQSEVLRSLYNDAWEGKYNHVPLQDYEVKSLLKGIKPVLKSEHYVQINANKTPVAMALVIPNIYDLNKGIGGKPSPLGWAKMGIRLLRHEFTSARVILLGVSKTQRGTMLGALLPSLLIKELFKARHTNGYEWVELGWVQEDDTGMRNLCESLVNKPYKTHTMFKKELKS